MSKIKHLIMDFYLNHSIIIDVCLIVIIWLVSKYYPFIDFKIGEKGKQLDIISNLIGCSVSLAGFILAALTIIVTFKSNINAKGFEEANNAMEMILSSPHYDGVVKVFKSAIIEFTLCFLILAAFWASSDNLSIWTLYRVNVSALVSISLSIFRSLLILFSIIQMDKKQS
jgi:hypothetical protein